MHWRCWGLLTLGQGPAGEEDARQAAARELGQLWLAAREEASREAGLGDGSTRGRQRALVLCSFPTEAAAEHGDAEDGAGEGLAKGRWIRATAGGEGRQEAVDSGGGCDALLQDTGARKGSGR